MKHIQKKKKTIIMQNINELGDSSTIKIDEKTSGNNNEAKIIEKENKKQTNGKNSKKILMEKKIGVV